MATLKSVLIIGIVIVCVVTGVFNFAISLNGVSSYHHEAGLTSIENSPFAELVSNSSSFNQNVSNGMMLKFANVSSGKQDWTVIFGLGSLVATTLLGALQQALFLPTIFSVMITSVAEMVNVYADISILTNLIGSLVAIFLTFKIFEFFFLSQK